MRYEVKAREDGRKIVTAKPGRKRAEVPWRNVTRREHRVCKHCPRPVEIRYDGTPAAMCVRHLELQRVAARRRRARKAAAT